MLTAKPLYLDRTSKKVNKKRCCLIPHNEKLIAAIKDVSDKLKSLKLYQFNENNSEVELLEGCEDLRKRLEEENGDSLEDDVAVGKPRENLIFIYTSGTTGLPKAAVITNIR